MTFDEFKVDFLAFLKNSTVNLGRKTAKTRQTFIDAAMVKFNKALDFGKIECGPAVKKEQAANPMDGSVICIKPNDNNKALNVGKGVHAMTSSESMRADEQLGRSPYGKGKENKE